MACKKDIPFEPLNGFLVGRPPISETSPRNFRVALNTAMPDKDRLGRMPGWHGLMKDWGGDRCNRDLHDQLLGCTGYFIHALLTRDALIPRIMIVSDITAPTVDLHVTTTEGFEIGQTKDPIRIRDFIELVITKIDAVNNIITVRNNSTDPSFQKGGNVITGDEVIQKFVSTSRDQRREAITMLEQVVSDCENRLFVAGTRSRLYASTGTASNWRLLLDGAGGVPQPEDGPYSSPRFSCAQLGNYVIFVNDYDPVMAWRIDDAPSCFDVSSAKIISELVGLDIRSAGCVVSWKGFILIGDVVTSDGRKCSQIYWSDFNNPTGWFPGPESISGFVDLGMGEKVLWMAAMGGQLKVYTDRAIYNVTMVGGAEILRFVEVYRGPDTLGFRYGLANCGDSHIYLTTTGIVELQQYLNSPVREEWMYNVSGLIFYGLDGRLLNSYPGGFKAFQEIDALRCHQVIAGYNSQRREVWFSWPTKDADDPNNLYPDPEGRRRMTLVLSRLYGHSSLIDHGFSCFCDFVPWASESVRDWMVSIGACDKSQITEFLIMKEGDPCNIPDTADPKPKYLINADNDPEKPVDPNSVCAIYGNQDIKKMCIPCTVPRSFAMASLSDFCIKELAIGERLREFWRTTDGGITGTYINEGYEFLLQSESSIYGNTGEKRIYGLEVDMIHQDEAPPLNMHAQIGVSPMVRPDCGEFWDSVTNPIDCSPIEDVPELSEARGVGPLYYPFFCTGRYVAWRLFISARPTFEEDAIDYSPLGGVFDLTRINITLSLRPRC